MLHLQYEGHNVPDVQDIIDLQPDTSYRLCYWVSASRPTKSLP